jgi:hypothetical protein
VTGLDPGSLSKCIIGPGEKKEKRKYFVGLAVSGSVVLFFLELRNFLFFLFLSEVETGYKNRGDKYYAQQCFKKGFHQNLPSSILIIARKKSMTSRIFLLF